jgi:hypothetical protein
MARFREFFDMQKHTDISMLTIEYLFSSVAFRFNSTRIASNQERFI